MDRCWVKEEDAEETPTTPYHKGQVFRAQLKAYLKTPKGHPSGMYKTQESDLVEPDVEIPTPPPTAHPTLNKERGPVLVKTVDPPGKAEHRWIQETNLHWS